MLKSKHSSSSVSSSKQEFEGAAIDILDELSRILGFSYTIYLSPDGKAGVENPSTGEWNGAIKEIVEKVRVFSLDLHRYTSAKFHRCSLVA